MNRSNNEKRIQYPLAIFLSSFIFLTWMYFFGPSKADLEQNQSSSDNTENKTIVKETVVPSELLQKNNFVSKKQNKTKKEKIIFLNSAAMEIKLSNKNAAIVSVRIQNNYDEKNNKIGDFSPNLEKNTWKGFETGRLIFFTDAENNLFLFSHDDLYYRTISAEANKVVFSSTLSYKNNAIEITKTYKTTEDPYRLDMKIAIFDKKTKTPISLPYYILNGSQIGMQNIEEKSSLDVERLSCQKGDENQVILAPSFFGEDEKFEICDAPFDWIAIDNRFYMRILKSKQPAQKALFSRKSINNKDKQNYLLSYLLMGGQEPTNTVSWYYLPKNRKLLNTYHEKSGFYFFDLFHQFSIMRVLSSAMYWVIRQINSLVNNYGWSILLMTLLLKVVTFPLTQKSLKSMNRMRQLAPKIEEIKKRNKNNSQKVSIEMMSLYKKEGVSPLSGCLPMVVPIPIFIALYSLFQNMVELKGASFMWIKDLSLPDTVMYLSFSLPFLGNSVKILPIIMTTISFIQALMPNEMAPSENPQMKHTKYIFPILFFFICWTLPSGLVLFWTAQNLFSLLQTLLLQKMGRSKK